jgi:hypothetical protein
VKRLIPAFFIAVALLEGGVGRAQNPLETKPSSQYRQNYSDQGTYRGSYGDWGLLGLCGLFGLLGARRGRTYESTKRIRTYEPRPTH